MPNRNDVPPDSVGVALREEGVFVEYLDGRDTLYRGAPSKKTGSLETPPGKEVHVLVTDASQTEGVMMYVNDLKTHDAILEDSGVGRVILSGGDSELLFPGVTAVLNGERTVIQAEMSQIDGRVFVFVEDDWNEESYELVAESS
jgi:hypothetical protein